MFYLKHFISVVIRSLPHDISKTDAATITKSTRTGSTMSSRNPFILGSEGQRSRSQMSVSFLRQNAVLPPPPLLRT